MLNEPLVTAMQQIAEWLKRLGPSEYTERFAENRIDFSVLQDLTDQHLKDLGIALGDRLKMLRAIRELNNPPGAVRVSPAPAVSEPTRQVDAERRQLTVMFCDRAIDSVRSRRPASDHQRLSSLLHRPDRA
jgi:hypothetical protein